MVPVVSVTKIVCFFFQNIAFDLINFPGSGKSHTMLGSGTDYGIVPKSIEWLFDHMPDESNFNAEFFEIYNENFIDLLKEIHHPEQKPIDIKTTMKNGENTEAVVNATKINIGSFGQFIEVLQMVSRRRKVSETVRNTRSSRSHFVVQIEFMAKLDKKVMFVDLAGCENSNDHLETDRQMRQTEMSNINKSVSNFRSVIESLKKNETAPDFRSSKLTRLLKPCLTKNTKTMIVTTISQNNHHISTSKESLELAQAAGKIRIKDAKKNEP